jgi:hypothetical protein
LIDILIVAPSDESGHPPSGFIFANEVFEQAGLKDKVTASQATFKDLRRELSYLVRRYPKRLRVHWVEPLSLRGLYVKIRFRLHAYPVILLFSSTGKTVLTGKEIERLSDHIVEILSKPQNPVEEL